MKQMKLAPWIDWFFKDKQGKWAIIQFPNVLLWLWLLLSLVNYFAHNQQFSQLQSAVLFAWAYLELTQGSSYFRKVFGAVILAVVVVGLLIK